MAKKTASLVIMFIFLMSVTVLGYGEWLWPVPQSFQINSLDYYNDGSLHSQGQSVDIGSNWLNGNDERPEIVSCTSGTVVNIVDTYPDYGVFDGSWGNYVMVRYNGYNIVYAHLKSVSQEAYDALESGAEIAQGTKLGIMGTSGNSTGVHLHLQVFSASSPYGSYDTSFVVFDEFLDNPEYYPAFTFWSGLETYSKRYGLRLRTDYTYSDGVYYHYTGDDTSTESYSMSPWAAEEIASSVEKGIIPEAMRFNYQNYISRIDFCRLAVQFLETATGTGIDGILNERGLWADTDTFSDTHNYEVSAISALGIVSGRGDGTFDPYSPVTRQEAAAMIKRTAEILGTTQQNNWSLAFSDLDTVADWAKESVDFVSGTTDPTTDKPVMGGLDGNNFEPLGTFTRQQAYISMVRLFNAITESR